MNLVTPSLLDATSLLKNGNTIPLCCSISAEITPIAAYLKLTHKSNMRSFLFESVLGGEKIGRYSMVGVQSSDELLISVGEDPLPAIESKLKKIRQVSHPDLPPFTGGAVGFISYDCVNYFEPSTKNKLIEPLGLPESLMMFCKTVIIFDHLYAIIKVVSNIILDDSECSNDDPEIFQTRYKEAVNQIRDIVGLLRADFVSYSS